MKSLHIISSLNSTIRFALRLVALILLAWSPRLAGQTTPVFTTLHSFSATDSNFDNSDGAIPFTLVEGSDGNFYGTTQNGGSDGYGTVFEITSKGEFTVLHTFDEKDGADPEAGLVQGNDGNFYGTTFNNAGADFGTVFKMTPAGKITTLHVFTGSGTDGAFPEAVLTQGIDGNFYGTTQSGGSDSSSGYGTVFKITPGGKLTLLYIFTDTATDGAFPVAGLVQGSDGNFYGTTSGDQSNQSINNSTVFKMTPAGKLTTLHRFTGSGTDGNGATSAVIQASDGNFYGTTAIGGTSNHGTVYRITTYGAYITLHSFTGESLPQAALMQGRDGNFYGTTEFGGANALGTVFQITPAGSLTILHNFTGADGEYSHAALVQARDGSFYGTTSFGGSGNNGTVFKISLAPVIISAAKANGQVGKAFAYRIAATNTPTSFNATGLPAGLNLDQATGLISGKPTVSGSFTVHLTATNVFGTGSATLALSILPGVPVITSAATATGQIGVPFSYQITASHSPTAYAASGLPAGLSVDTATGLISGTPSAMGTFSVDLSAANAGGTGTTTLALTILPATPVITSAATASAQVGTAFTYQITATNGPTSYAASGLPGGLHTDRNTGLISGTPTKAGTFTVGLSAANAGGTGTAALTLSITLQPIVLFTNPPADETVASGTTLDVTAAVTDSAGVLTGVQIYVNGTAVATTGGTGLYVASGVAFRALNSQDTPYVLKVVATDRFGGTSTDTHTITATVPAAGSGAPTVKLLTKLDGHLLTPGETVPLVISASSGNGAPLRTVEVYANGALLQSLDASSGETIFRVDYTVPAPVATSGFRRADLQTKELTNFTALLFNQLQLSSSDSATATTTDTDQAPTIIIQGDVSEGKHLIVGRTYQVSVAVTPSASGNNVLKTLAYALGNDGGEEALPAVPDPATSTAVNFTPPVKPGKYAMVAAATDPAGSSTYASITVTVDPAPVVTITKKRDAVEGSVKGVAVITRTGDTSEALTVSYTTKGSAAPDVDYKTLTSPVMIPVGAASAKIKIKPIDNMTMDGTRKAKVKLLPSADGSYTVGDASVGKIKIFDND